MKPIDPRLLRRARSARRALVRAVAIGGLQTVAVVTQAVILAEVVAAVVAEGATVADQRGWLVALAGVAGARAVLAGAAPLAGRSAATAVKSELRDDLLGRLVTLEPGRRSSERRGELAVLIGPGLDALDGWFAQYLPQLVLAATVPPVVVAVTAAGDPIAGLILVVTIPLIPLFLALVGLATRARTERQWRALTDLGGHLLDVIEGLPTLRIFGRARHQEVVLAELADEHRAASMGALRWAFASSLVLELIATLGTAVVAVAVGLRLLHGSLDLRTGLLALLLAPEAYLPLRNVGASFHASAEGALAAEQALDLLEEPRRAPAASGGAGRAPARLHPIAFEAVSVVRPERSRPALDGVSLTLAAGERVAVVGPSGAGKSTLLAVLLGFVTPHQGRVTVGGVDLAELDLEAWRRQLAWVPQQGHLFAGSIAANIRLGAPRASDTEVRRAAEVAGLAARVDRLPAGFASMVGAGGIPLSGGEVQRIALARAVLRDAPVVLLDEPTASLDPGTEREVLARLHHVLENRTALVVTHRRAPLELVDRAVVLERGRLVDVSLAEALGVAAEAEP